MSQRYSTVRRGEHVELTETGHLVWQKLNNPDGWDDETWRAFTVRCSSDPAFKDRCRREKAAGRARPHPLDDGWRMPPNADPVQSVMKGFRR